MGIISFSHSSMLSVLLAPVHALAAWFVPAQNASGRSSGQFTPPAAAQRARQLVLPFASGRAPLTGTFPEALRPAAASAAGAKIIKLPLKKPAPSRLRVVREFDSNVGPACAGRMVISGRMADVCAELERMAQREAALQAQ
ncbi:hypothetical protein SAMN05216350_102226 [Polaromonas sp. YR568]|uniref:hypothetical protein n=1 Tax=Polaromonas sp. YR568 TaxID=1855301 RepID=UPI0008F2B092|nr:hypothetical protein [Polaromonas sp. YR568]SFU50261.1 hypothetical protein SAMN05216350_102226 [Polaromonas sp. YR568]